MSERRRHAFNSTTKNQSVSARSSTGVAPASLASIRHEDTPYDELLVSGVDRQEARDQVREPCSALSMSGGSPAADCRYVTTIRVMSETMSLAAVKARFSELIDRVERQQDRVIVTRNGKPAAVLISIEDLESLEETLAVMSDRSIAAQIRESEKAKAAGDTGADLEELRIDFEQRRAGRK